MHVEKLPEPKITSSTGDAIICLEYPSKNLLSGLTLDCGLSGSNYTYSWTYSDGITTTQGIATTPTIAVHNSGTYGVVVTGTNQYRCPSASQSFTVVPSGPADLQTSSYQVNNAFEEDQSIIIDVKGYGIYEYSLDEGPFQSSNVFSNVSYGVHSVVVRDVKGQTSCGTITIDNILTIDYPHYFTPNGDGFNDTWNIPGLKNQTDSRILIFDRNGKLLKEISPSGTGWDGTYNENKMPASDYWFTVEFVDNLMNQRQFKSHFALKR